MLEIFLKLNIMQKIFCTYVIATFSQDSYQSLTEMLIMININHAHFISSKNIKCLILKIILIRNYSG